MISFSTIEIREHYQQLNDAMCLVNYLKCGGDEGAKRAMNNSAACVGCHKNMKRLVKCKSFINGIAFWWCENREVHRFDPKLSDCVDLHLPFLEVEQSSIEFIHERLSQIDLFMRRKLEGTTCR
jgi:hypothetical protein